MKNKIVIAGGTGFIGKYLATGFQRMGYDILIVSRRDGDVQWNDLKGLADALEDATMVINLAGKSVDCRYNEKNKSDIMRSRVETTRMIGDAIIKCKNPPALWINSSTATIYRHAEDRAMTEEKGDIGKGFSVEVAKSWEAAFFSFSLKQTRRVALRMAIVLGKGGGVIKPFLNLVRYGLGGRQGNGRQMFSWIHIADVFGIIEFILDHKELSGVYNCSAPSPVRNQVLMRTFREKMHRKLGLRSPGWLLAMGAVIIRTETELILKSRWVIPERLLRAGYNFKYPMLDGALEDVLDNK